MHLSQHTRHVAGFNAPKDLPIPVDMAVFHGETGKLLSQKTHLLNQKSQTVCFDGLDLGGVRPVISVLRNFSAPVKLEFKYSDDELAKLVSFEPEGFNRWQAMQTLINRLLLGQSSNTQIVIDSLKQAVPSLIDNDPMLAAKIGRAHV